MKHSIIALAILSAVGSAMADTTYKSPDRRASTTVHSAGLRMGQNTHGNFQVAAFVTMTLDTKGTFKSMLAVTGCDQKNGGKITVYDGDDTSPGKPWRPTEDTFLDTVAVGVCKEAARQIEANDSTRNSTGSF